MLDLHAYAASPSLLARAQTNITEELYSGELNDSTYNCTAFQPTISSMLKPI